MRDVGEVGTRRQLLFDDRLIERKQGVRRAPQQARKHGEPLMVPDRPWERSFWGDSNVTVMEDGGRYRMWYVVPNPEFGSEDAARHAKGTLETRRGALCYAESDDGLRWRKPSLDFYVFNGGETNALLFGRMGATVFKDPRAPSAERYKLIYGAGPRLPHFGKGHDGSCKVYHAIHGAVSPDGLRWTPIEQPILPWYTDTTNVACWDDRIGRYVAYVRWDEGITYKNHATYSNGNLNWYRAIARSESDDFRRFPPPTKILEPTPAERAEYARCTDLYNTAAVKYPFAAESYFFFVSLYDHASDMLQVQLCAGRDGIAYERYPGVFLPVGPEGAFDSKRVYMATGLIAHGDELRLYYLGRSTLHGANHAPSLADGTGNGDSGLTGIGMARLRRDGFVAQEFGDAEGIIETVPLAFEGDVLKVNYVASEGGWLRAELLDAEGRPLPGYAGDAAERVGGDAVSGVMRWNGAAECGALAARPVRLRLTGRRVKMFAFQFDHTPGEAQ